jgi:hypothetical protein
MKKISRTDFLKFGALASIALISKSTFAGINHLNTTQRAVDTIFLNRLSGANDKQVALLLEAVKEGNLSFSRKTAYDIAALSAAYCYKASAYYQSELLITKLKILLQFLLSAQAADGTVNVGNLESPPDTAFVMEILCPANMVLLKENDKKLTDVISILKKIITKAGEALSKGGVHTPNHRWVICSALAQINFLYPDKKYTNRIADWLDEGVFIDKDGHFPERSGTYSAVETAAFINIARFVNKPSLLEPVRKNLQLMYFYIEENGELVSNDSRRQDQYAARSSAIFYLQYRYLANKDNSAFYAAVAKKIESAVLFDKEVLSRSLIYFLEDELLQQQMPAPLQLNDSYEKLVGTSHLLRIKRKDVSATLFGGVDWPLIIASGRSCSPNFFSYRKGNAILKYMRLSAGFFSMGYFYSQGIQKHGNKYILHKKLEVPYYQPLPKAKRNTQGDYLLSPSIDNRFWNKMNFKNRPVSNIKTLETIITFYEDNGAAIIEFDIKGFNEVPVTIELCFNSGGTLTGVSQAENSAAFLETGNAAYSSNGSTIEFGPGSKGHKNITGLEGERYSTHFGSLKTEGEHVYITGKTPFKHTLTFR